MIWWHKALAGTTAVVALTVAGGWSWVFWRTAEFRESVCYGTPSGGHQEGGKRLPYQGPNYRASSRVLWMSGRMSLNGALRDALAEAYDEVAKAAPDLRFVYGEMSWPDGGRFPPHKTHRNGLSVDFMTPLRDASGAVVELPVTFANHFGYEQHFDTDGRDGPLRIDFPAVARHITALHDAAAKRGIAIRVVILEPELQERLFAIPEGAALRSAVRFSVQRPWVRHDNHYHIDFTMPCRPEP